MNDGSIILPVYQVRALSGYTEKKCYLRTSVLTAQSGDSLEEIDAGAPDNTQSHVLVPGDVCLVKDAYSRVYFYRVESGSGVTDAPSHIQINENLYWGLVDVLASTYIKVEQFYIASIPADGEFIITHTQHNRGHSFAPVVQVLKNSKIVTSYVRVFSISPTQLRVVPVLGVVTGVYVNVFIST